MALEKGIHLFNPFNLSLKNKILDRLSLQQKKLIIALSFNEISKMMHAENFYEVIDKTNELIIKKLENIAELPNILSEEEVILKNWLGIALNLKGLASRRIIETKEPDMQTYKKKIQDLIAELSWSSENNDPYNFASYLQIHYLYLLLAKDENNIVTKRKFEDQAEHYLGQAIQLAPMEPTVLSAQALHYMRKEEYERAILAFDIALSYDPNNVGILHNRADMYLKLGERDNKTSLFKSAYKDLKNANRLKPHDCNIVRLTILSNIHMKNCSEANNEFENVYKPLCVDQRRSWDNVSDVRDKSFELIKSKLSSICHCGSGA